MKIAVVAENFPVASQTFVVNHIHALSQQGQDVSVYSFEPAKEGLKNHPMFVSGNLEHKIYYGIHLPKNKLSRIIGLLKLLIENIFVDRKFSLLNTLNFFKYKNASNFKLYYRAQLFKDNPVFDIIHCHFGDTGADVQSLISLGFLKGKLVVSFHGYEFLKKEYLERNDNYRKLFEFGNAIVANSTFTLNRLQALGCKPEKLRIIPVIPETSIFNLSNDNEKVNSSIFRILSVARLVEKKGIRYGIEAIKIFKNKLKVPVRYDIIGSGPLMNSLLALVKKESLEEVVFLHGTKSQQEIAMFFQNSDLFLLPSVVANGDTETQGLVLIEAQMMEIPVLSTLVGGIPDSVKNGETGILVDERSPEQLADALETLYADSLLRKKMGKAGVEYVKTNFNSAALTGKMLKLYGELCAR